MKKEKPSIFKITGHTQEVNGKSVERDLNATGTTTVSAADPLSTNQISQWWELKEKDGNIRITSFQENGNQLFSKLNNKGVCMAGLELPKKEVWFYKDQDGSTSEFFIQTTDDQPDCYNSKIPKYLTMGKIEADDKIPITFEPEIKGAGRKSQKWKFKKVPASPADK